MNGDGSGKRMSTDSMWEDSMGLFVGDGELKQGYCF